MKIHKIALGATLLATALTAGAQSAQRKPYIVQITEAPAAAYEGGVSGLVATKPAVGKRINVQAAAVQTYLRHVNAEVNAVAAAVPAARVYQRYGVVLSGFAAMLTPDELNRLTITPGVRAIVADEPRKLDTSYTTSTFLGLAKAGGAWSMTDAAGRALKGEGVIIAMVDGGVWPENVSVSDKVDTNGKPVPAYAPGAVVYDPLPAGRYKGSCQAGEAFTSAMCNNKLIGAQNFNAGMKMAAPNLVGEYDSPRDAGGHGTHTLTTAGGNANSEVSVFGSPFTLSGVAPRARLAAYKVCNQIRAADGTVNGSCYPSDSVAAIEKAVADGVDVINYSISGSQTSFLDPVEQAMKGATAAGVFVAMSAGNSGPGNTVAHISPWVATVGNSTHDRAFESTVTLGSGVVAQGPSVHPTGVGVSPLIWSRDAGFGAPAGAGSNQAVCFGAADSVAPLLDPAKVAGKILVCDRGVNVFVNKIANAKAAGAVGLIILNRPAEGAVAASANTVITLVDSLPVVHLAASNFSAVTAEARKVGGTAAIGASVAVAGSIAPVMAGSSSRGPNRRDFNIMKPDITAPGTDIIAGYTPGGITAAERAALIAGTAIGRQGADMISGTSMSSPHVAGAAALLKQARPTWSPSAIKSALMTSAGQTVKLSTGAPDLDRWGYGAGHLDPNAALATTVVYDITPAEYDAYSALALSGLALNLPSITAGSAFGTVNLPRRLTNLGAAPVTLNASMTSLSGFDVAVTPSTLTIAPGATANFTVRITHTTAPGNVYSFGNLTWTGSGQNLISPVSARLPTLIVPQSDMNETRSSGSRIFSVATGFKGPMITTASGMVPATRKPGRVAEGAESCSALVIPAGALLARVQLFNSETQEGAATDLDLSVYNPAGARVASAGGTSDELVSLVSPAAGTYEVCVEGYATVGTAADFVLNTWVVGPASGVQTLRAAGPSSAYLGGTASVVASWSVAPGARYLGRVLYRQTPAGAALGATSVFVDATPNAATFQAAAPVERIKQAR